MAVLRDCNNDAPTSGVQVSGRAQVPQIRAETYEMKITLLGNSLEVQWLGLGTLTVMGLSLIEPMLGTKIPQDASCGQKTNKQKNPSKHSWTSMNVKDGLG